VAMITINNFTEWITPILQRSWTSYKESKGLSWEQQAKKSLPEHQYELPT